MLKFQEAANCASGSIAISTYPKTLIARRYVLQRKLGSGSFGTVYLVSDKKAKQGEELKVLKEISVGGLNPNETVQANLEAQLLSKLDHPAIVKFHASFVEQDNLCIITEYCEKEHFYKNVFSRAGSNPGSSALIFKCWWFPPAELLSREGRCHGDGRRSAGGTAAGLPGLRAAEPSSCHFLTPDE
nr:PREDICTED: serine/threonine-protein kinase Nek11-like [Equus przewalskii]